MEMRIVTRPDFDGVVCAVLLKQALHIESPIQWIQPNDIQNGLFHVQPNDIIANLPYDARCALWFDHHISNAIETPFKGLFRVAPSAAGLIFEYYQTRLNAAYTELIEQTDRIDSAQLTLNEILHPETYPYVILSMATSFDPTTHIQFCNHIVELLRNRDIQTVLSDPEVSRRCRQVENANAAYKQHLISHTHCQRGVSITDFRGLKKTPEGNRFLIYSLFPECYVNIKLFNEGPNVSVKVGHSIINKTCRINVGKLMADYGGGGHRGAGACRLKAGGATEQIETIVRILMANLPNDE